MDDRDPDIPGPPEDRPPSDLARRLARYRRRIEAEGRPRSVRVVDQAIKDASKDADKDA